ncbi:DUF6279 family lipoprotein [Kangiella shandongensis]|uniref:DUF6279 family lipoprotein n=1 Tax=Kangiella shandongensis TaxID=2763258 RepID=UPI001CC10B07|nr:DUF6279 family lipoprotein [Kangiella shandongensis]
MKISVKVICFALALFTLQACGFQFWYNRLGWLSTWYADDYVTLTSVQEERIESLVDKHALWHRQTQLPRYNQFIDDVLNDVKSKQFKQNYDTYGERLVSFYHDILAQVLNDAVRELSQLSDAQVKELMQNLNASAQSESKDYLAQTDEKRLENAHDEAIESYEEWFGSLTDSQENLIIETVNQLKPTGKLRIEYLKEWRQAFKLALAERRSESGQQALHSLLRNPRQLRSPQLIENSEHNNQLRKALQLKLFESASEEQTEHFIDYLNEYREDFTELIADAN